MNLLRAASSSSCIHDTLRDVLYALRTFKRAPVAALTIVFTVALGLGLITVAFTVLNALLFREDAVPDVSQMFAVERSPTSDAERQGFTRAQLDALRHDTNIFTDAYAERSQVDSRVDGRTMWGTFVTGNFFRVLGVSAALGRELTPADDELDAGEAVMVLSYRGWDRLFARDPAVLGRRVIVNGAAMEIVGVMPEAFRGLTIAPDDYWAPLSMLGQVRPSHADHEAGLDIVGRLKPGMSPQAAVTQLAAWDAGTFTRRDPPTSLMTLVPRRGTVRQPSDVVPVTAPLFFAFGLILLIGCANVANLLLARGVARQRDIGIQLSLGATRHRVVRQLMTESLLLALAAAVAGFAVSRVVLETMITGLMNSVPPDVGDIRWLIPGADWRVLLFLIFGALLSTLAFALAPALQATRIEPLRAIRGEAVGNARPRGARNLLIALQVSASALLLISAAVFLRSAFAAATFNPGMRTSDTVAVQIVNESKRNAIVQAISADPSVIAVAASWPDPPRAAVAQSGGASAAVAYKFVSPEYFSVLDIAIVRGRGFAAAERAPDLSVAIVSESTARTLWPNSNPIGGVIQVDADRGPGADGANEPRLESRTFTVVGIARDVAGLRVAPLNRAAVYVPTSAVMPKTLMIARVHGDPERARQALLDRFTAIDSDMGRQVVTLRTLARIDTYVLRMAFWLTVALGGLALALTLSGLFSVLSYLVAQRTREIGVRMALGATARDVVGLVLFQTIRPVGLGLFIGGGLAAAAASLLLTTPAAAGIGEIVRVLDPLAYVASLFVIVTACLLAASVPAIRAARLDPTQTLRRE